MFGLERKQSMPSPADALPGRDTPMPVPAKHYVLGTPMEPEETESLRFALFGLGCFWGVERRYWQLDGVYTTADAEQHALAVRSGAEYQNALDAAKRGRITTEILPAPVFYFAEEYHQQYLAKNPGGYCGMGGTGVRCVISA